MSFMKQEFQYSVVTAVVIWWSNNIQLIITLHLQHYSNNFQIIFTCQANKMDRFLLFYDTDDVTYSFMRL